MNTHTSVTKKLAAVVIAAATSASLGLATVPAQAATMPAEALSQLAKPTRIGPVTGLAAQVTKPNSSYRVSASWNTLAGASSYEARLKHAGTVVSKANVTQPTWTTTTALPAGSNLVVEVVPLAGRRRGLAASTSLVLPDLTAPVGQYTLTLEEQTGFATATVTEDALSDDVTAREQIKRWIDWGLEEDGKTWEEWTTGQTITFEYPELGRWEPKMRLEDQAGNRRDLPLKVVVTGDLTAPTGTFETRPLNPWANYTRVVLTQTALDDNWTPTDKVVRVVDWMDGSEPTPWTAGETVRHVYRSGGTYTPSVLLVDEAGNDVVVDSTPVTVRVDAAAPKVTVRVPKRRAAYVASWKTLRGTARDYVGTGVRQVLVRVVEKRGGTWYAYRAPGRRWVAAGSTRASAMRKTRAGVATLTAGRWTMSVARLRKGTIVVKASATDRVGNASKPVLVSKRLTR